MDANLSQPRSRILILALALAAPTAAGVAYAAADDGDGASTGPWAPVPDRFIATDRDATATWQQLDGGGWFRSASSDERTINAWAPATFLIVAPPGTDVATQTAFSLPLPWTATATRDVSFTWREDDATPPRVAVSTPAGTMELATPTYRLFTGAADGIVAVATASASGALHARAALDDAALEVFSATPSWHLEEPAPPGFLLRVAAGPAGPGQCELVRSWGFSASSMAARPGAGPCLHMNTIEIRLPHIIEIDPPETVAYDIGMFGEVKYCTDAGEGAWDVLLRDNGAEIEAGFAATNANIVHTWSHCWLADSASAADGCAQSGGCYHAHSTSHQYPYNSCDKASSCYRDNAWDDQSHAVGHNSAITVDLVQAVHDGFMTPSTAGCGRAGFSADAAAAASVVLDDRTGTVCKEFVTTHEVGHNFNAVHPDATVTGSVCPGGGSEQTVMKKSGSSSCRANVFSVANLATVNSCVESSSCP